MAREIRPFPVQGLSISASAFLHNRHVIGIFCLYPLIMPRLSISTRRRVIALYQSGLYSIREIRRRLREESIFISLQALWNLVRKHRETGKVSDLPRRSRPRKLSQEMMDVLELAWSENDELTARQARSLLMERWPELRVSIQTIKRIRKQMGWVATRPHYCQLLRDVS